MRNPPARSSRSRRIAIRCALAALGAYLLLLIPDTAPPRPAGAGQKPFVWQRDAYWAALEADFQSSRTPGCAVLAARIAPALEQMRALITAAQASALPPEAPVFDQIETNFFHLASMVGACSQWLPEFLELSVRIRGVVKRQSERWSMDASATRQRLYRALYGTRAAVEEVMLQAPRGQLQPLLAGDDEPSAAPGAMVRGVNLRSGDMLVSRGGAASSALIARGE